MNAVALTCLSLVLSGAPTVVELVDQLKDCQSLETCPAVKQLVAGGPAIWPGIKRGLDAPDEMTRFWTLGVLSEVIVPAARQSIATLLGDREIRVRAAAAYALGAQRDRAVTPWLVKALEDDDLNVRFAAAVALGRVRDPASIPALVKVLRDKDEDVRAYAALALGDIGDRAATPRLVERVREDIHPKVRGFAAMALGKLKDPKSLGALMAQAREERDAKALASALYALGALGDPKAIAVIRPHLAHADSDVREYAKDALKRLKKE
ncbi:MAG: HEAT repeat domain-containing protein [Myxococcota bacterium]|jgi:HEAT repeat protein|nr:HEAT repeat domain-containing protein [Myxococcota bacterium]